MGKFNRLAILSAFAFFTSNAASNSQEQPVQYKDWTVQCASREDRKFCVMTQVLTISGQQGSVLRLELGLNEAGNASGFIVLPFGLAISKGISLSIDGGARWNLPFRTCRAFGCVVPLSLGQDVLNTLKTSDVLKVYLYTLDGTSNPEIGVSLAGFTAAFEALEIAQKYTSE